MKITYEGGEIISELDKAITEVMKSKGYHFYASGMDLQTGVRDLSFDPPSETTTASTE